VRFSFYLIFHAFSLVVWSVGIAQQVVSESNSSQSEEESEYLDSDGEASPKRARNEEESGEDREDDSEVEIDEEDSSVDSNIEDGDENSEENDDEKEETVNDSDEEENCDDGNEEEEDNAVDSDEKEKPLGNSGWADAMLKVLKTNKPKKKKTLVLSRAKKLNETSLSLKEEPKNEPGFEIDGDEKETNQTEEKDEKPDIKPVLSSAEMREQKKKVKHNLLI